MTRILFVCHGNICRSPLAEIVMNKLIADSGLDGTFSAASAATSTEELGNPIYPPVRELLRTKGIAVPPHRARQVTRRDYDEFDLLIVMDRNNLRNLQRITGGDPDNKISLLLDWTERGGEVADPWYSGNFDATWEDVTCGCRALLEKISGECIP